MTRLNIIKHAAGWPGYRESDRLILAAELTPYTYTLLNMINRSVWQNKNRNTYTQHFNHFIK
jgi:hypothetical protein